MALRPIRLLTLDLDDTLVDSDGTAVERIADAMRRARELLGAALDDASAERIRAAAVAADPVVEGRLATLVRLLPIAPEDERVAEIRAAYNARLLELLRAFPDMHETLRALRDRYRLVIITNGPEELQRSKVERFGLQDAVDDVVISGALGIHKPDPRIFWEACRRAGIDPAEAAHVGDAITTDVAGAQGAGMGAIWCRPERARALTEADLPVIPDLTIERFHELPSALA
ncbi:MAG: HAD family hydrolase [Dehalococcoidia bacterium]|nr:MAG: HAD family hydrolase [Dehalococcoidia bacterium]